MACRHKRYSAAVQRIDNLTGARALAALWVVLFHLNLLDTPLYGRLGVVVEHGLFGVDVFFVLSGFVLSLVYAGRIGKRVHWPEVRGFLLRRLCKIYPLHLLTLIGMVLLVQVASHLHYNFTARADNTAWSALCSVLLVHAMGTTSALSWNAPSWSVSAEWFAYLVLCLPMLFFLRHVRVRWVALGAVMLVALLTAATPLLGEPWTGLNTRGALRIMPDFLCGYLLFRLLHQRTVLPSGGALLAGGGVGLLLACYLPHGDVVLLLPATMLLLAGLYRGGPGIDRVLGARPLVRLGEASYSMYLLQLFVMIAARQVMVHAHLQHRAHLAIGLMLLVPFACAGVGLLCFRWVEEPVRLALLRWCSQRGLLERRAERVAVPLPGDRADTQVTGTVG